MAEYIDRELAIQEIQSWDNNGFISKPTSKIPQILSEKNVPTADVIERSKVDKAIKEIEKESYSESVYGDLYKETTKVISVEDVLEIIKRNIGE